MAVNIQSGQYRRPAAHRRGSGTSRRSGMWALWVVKVVVVVCVVGAECNAYIYLRQGISETNRDIRVTRNETALAEKEIESLRNRHEQLKSLGHIKHQLVRFNLNLRLPEHGQVRQLSVAMPGGAASGVTHSVAQR